MQDLDRGLANAALGAIDDAFERQVIVGLVDDAEIGQGVADLLALVKPGAADDAVGNGDGEEAFLELAGLKAGADEDGDVVEVTAAGGSLLFP